jgi:flagellar biogenesis protein FliO
MESHGSIARHRESPARTAAPLPALALAFARLRASWPLRKKKKALVVSETAPLGERRFVAVVQFERQRFLVGASPGSVTLLASLPDAADDADLSARETRGGSRE